MRQAGISVAITSRLGDGFPDCCIGYKGRNYLLEIKDPDKAPSKRKLTEDEQEWHRSWLGQVDIVETIDDVLAIIGIKPENL